MTLEFAQKRLLIVGIPEVFHVGAMLKRAAADLDIQTTLFDGSAAYRASWLVRQINWRLRGHYPTRMRRFNHELLTLCSTFRPDLLLVTGLLPPDAKTLATIRQMGIFSANYLTDDPWNPAHRARWFLDTLPGYDLIFSPRRANFGDLEKAGCPTLYLPFAFDPALHYPEAPPPEIASKFECDILFYGGADADRVALIAPLIEAGFEVHLYGGYWDRCLSTRAAARGMADPQTLRRIVNRAKVTLCLVRRANRDGHVMRTFEAPAMGACLLAEDTPEHREILGAEGESALYFRTVDEAKDKARYLLDHPEQRERLINGAQQRVVRGENTYAQRLASILHAAHGEMPGQAGQKIDG